MRSPWLLALASLAACGGRDGRVIAPPPPAKAAAPVETAATAAPPEPPPPASAPPVGIEPATSPPPPSKMPRVAFTSPKPNESIPTDKADVFQVRLDVKDLEAGGHVHLVLDGRPYKRIDDVLAPVRLGDIVPGEPLAPGHHVLVAFPSTPDHVAIKPHGGKSPLAAVAFWIGKPGKAAYKPTDPALVFSRPKGTYNGAAAERILLDFYLIGTGLAENGHAVHVRVTPPTGEPAALEIVSWSPFTITNLPNGDSRVRLELVDKDGRPVAGSWNTTERVITVNRDAVPEGAGGG